MTALSSNTNAQSFLDPKAVAFISNYPLVARLMVDGYFMGHHLGSRHAFSLEYSRHREYYPGDPLKLVDWKLFGKTDRFYVKQYEEETNLAAWLLMDISTSMGYQGSRTSMTKLRYATYLAAALSYLLLSQRDLVGMMLFDDRLRKVIKPSASSKQLHILLRELYRVKEGGLSGFGRAGKHAASRIKKRGLVILFSDLLAQPEEIEKTLKSFLYQHNEMIVFHVLSPDEMTFPFKRFGQFEDMETRQRILLQPDLFKDKYRREMNRYLAEIRSLCRKMRVDYQLLHTDTPYDLAIAAFLNTRMKMN